MQIETESARIAARRVSGDAHPVSERPRRRWCCSATAFPAKWGADSFGQTCHLCYEGKDEIKSPPLHFVANRSIAFRATWATVGFRHLLPREYRLRFYHTHTNERLDIIYRRGESYLPEALAALDHYLRDHRTGEVRHFDPHLFDLLHDLTASLNDSRGEIDVVCGYRTPWSNEFLRTRSAHTGVALHSLHMQAEAVDIRLPGISTAAVRDAALRLHRGGVGYYRNSNFVHVDVGRVRR
jgi:uncharacterized protein YcbK (DUF882 family)